jgi:hypothetical protein
VTPVAWALAVVTALLLGAWLALVVTRLLP